VSVLDRTLKLVADLSRRTATRSTSPGRRDPRVAQAPEDELRGYAAHALDAMLDRLGRGDADGLLRDEVRAADEAVRIGTSLGPFALAIRTLDRACVPFLLAAIPDRGRLAEALLALDELADRRLEILLRAQEEEAGAGSWMPRSRRRRRGSARVSSPWPTRGQALEHRSERRADSSRCWRRSQARRGRPRPRPPAAGGGEHHPGADEAHVRGGSSCCRRTIARRPLGRPFRHQPEGAGRAAGPPKVSSPDAAQASAAGGARRERRSRLPQDVPAPLRDGGAAHRAERGRGCYRLPE